MGKALLRDPLEGASIGLQIRRAALIVMALTWVYVVTLMPSGFYPNWFPWVASAGLMVPITGGLLAWRSPARILAWTQVVIVVACLLRLLEALVMVEPPGRVDYSPFSVTFTVAMGLTGIAFSPSVGVPLMLLSLAGLISTRIPVVGPFQSAGETVVHAAGGSVGFVVAHEVVRELARVRRVVEESAGQRSQATLEQERTLLRERWDALVHDTVLASLRLGARGEISSAPVAGEALAELSGQRGAFKDPLVEVRTVSRRLGLALDLQVPEWPDGPVGEALLVAAAEALTNVARHSGQREAVIELIWHDATVRMRVCDPGRGFDPDQVSAGSLGLRQVIDATMRSVGGHAEVDSRPGEGTTVSLVIDTQPSTRPAEEAPDWRYGSRVWLVGLVAVQMAGSIWIATLYVPFNVVAGLSLAGMVALPTLTAAAVLLPVRWPWWPLLLASTVTTWALLWGNLVDPQVPDWRTWFVGPFDALLVAVAIRDRLRSALAVIAISTAMGATLLWLRGESGFGFAMSQATEQTVMWALLGSFYARFMNSASRAIAHERLRSAGIETERRVTQAREEELVRRRQSLDAEVVPMLRRLAAGEVLDGDARQRCAELERTTRDQLVAGSLLEHDLVAHIAQARQRGARVSITGTADPGSDLETFHRSSAQLLGQARPGDRVQLTWRSGRSGLGPTMSLVGEGVGRGWQKSHEQLRRVDAEVSIDEDSVLIALQPQGPRESCSPQPSARDANS